MKQAKAIALIGLATSLILFAHYAGADEGSNGAARAGNQGVVTQGQRTYYSESRFGGPDSRRVAPGQIPRFQPHLEAADGSTVQGGAEVDECQSRTGNLILRLLIGQVPDESCN